MLLATHANPVLQPVIQDYQKIAGKLALGKNRAVAAQLGELKTLRRNLAVRMGEIDDYLNWVEAVKPETTSGMFDDYLKAEGDARARTTRRKDPLSLYLDAVETEF